MEGRSGEGGGLSEAIEALGWREEEREKREKEDKVWWKGKGMLRAAGNTWSATSGSRKLFAFFSSPLRSPRQPFPMRTLTTDNVFYKADCNGFCSAAITTTQ